MNHFRTSLLFGLLLVVFSSQGISQKFIDAEIILKDGKVMKGLASHKIKANSKAVKFKETKKGKVKEVSSDKIDFLIFRKGETESIWQYVKVISHYNKKDKIRETKKPGWLRVINICENVVMYEPFTPMDISRSKIYYVYQGGFRTSIYLRKKSEPKATLVSMDLVATNTKKKGTPTIRQYNKRALGKYLKNDPKIQSFAKDKQVTIDFLNEIFDQLCESE